MSIFGHTKLIWAEFTFLLYRTSEAYLDLQVSAQYHKNHPQIAPGRRTCGQSSAVGIPINDRG